MNLFAKIVNGFKTFTIFAKSSISDVQQLSNEYASEEDEQSVTENDPTSDDAATKNILKELGAYHMGKLNLTKRAGSVWRDLRVFFFWIYNLHFFKQKIYSHQALIYLDVPGIPAKEPLQNSW